MENILFLHLKLHLSKQIAKSLLKFEVTMEIKEKSSETNSAVFELVPRQKGIFKLRSNIEKKVVVSVQQLSQNSCKLSVERCFGMLVSPGRNGKSKFKRS